MGRCVCKFGITWGPGIPKNVCRHGSVGPPFLSPPSLPLCHERSLVTATPARTMWGWQQCHSGPLAYLSGQHNECHTRRSLPAATSCHSWRPYERTLRQGGITGIELLMATSSVVWVGKTTRQFKPGHQSNGNPLCQLQMAHTGSSHISTHGMGIG